MKTLQSLQWVVIYPLLLHSNLDFPLLKLLCDWHFSKSSGRGQPQSNISSFWSIVLPVLRLRAEPRLGWLGSCGNAVPATASCQIQSNFNWCVAVWIRIWKETQTWIIFIRSNCISTPPLKCHVWHINTIFYMASIPIRTVNHDTHLYKNQIRINSFCEYGHYEHYKYFYYILCIHYL